LYIYIQRVTRPICYTIPRRPVFGGVRHTLALSPVPLHIFYYLILFLLSLRICVYVCVYDSRWSNQLFKHTSVGRRRHRWTRDSQHCALVLHWQHTLGTEPLEKTRIDKFRRVFCLHDFWNQNFENQYTYDPIRSRSLFVKDEYTFTYNLPLNRD